MIRYGLTRFHLGHLNYHTPQINSNSDIHFEIYGPQFAYPAIYLL